MKSMRPEAASRSAIETPSSPGEPAIPVLVAHHPHADEEIAADALADRVQNLEAETHAIVERAAVGVVAPVGRGRPELVDQMPVAFELDPIEACRLHALGAVGVGLDHPRDVPVLHGLREGAVRRLAHVRRRDHRQPVRLAPARAAAEMRDLDHHRRAMRMDVVGEFLQPAHDLVPVEEDVAERLRAVRRDHRGAADHRQRDAALRLLGVIEAIARFRHAVLGIGGLMGRRHQPVAQGEMLELKGLKQRVARHVVPPCACGGPSWRGHYTESRRLRRRLAGHQPGSDELRRASRPAAPRPRRTERTSALRFRARFRTWFLSRRSAEQRREPTDPRPEAWSGAELRETLLHSPPGRGRARSSSAVRLRRRPAAAAPCGGRSPVASKGEVCGRRAREPRTPGQAMSRAGKRAQARGETRRARVVGLQPDPMPRRQRRPPPPDRPARRSSRSTPTVRATAPPPCGGRFRQGDRKSNSGTGALSGNPPAARSEPNRRPPARASPRGPRRETAPPGSGSGCASQRYASPDCLAAPTTSVSIWGAK